MKSYDIKKESCINLKNVIFDSLMENKSLFISIFILTSAYWLENVIFPKKFSKFTSDIPKFIENINFRNVFLLIFPYIIAEILFYINNIIVSHSLPDFELTYIKKITEQAIESIKTSKTSINVNEFVMNLKKLFETRSTYQLFVSYILPTILVGLGLIYYFFKADIKIGFASIIVMLIFLYITYHYESKTIITSYENENAINDFYEEIQDVMTNVDTIIISNEQQQEINNINMKKDIVYKTYKNTEIEASETTFKLHIINIIVLILFCGTAVKLYIDKKIDSSLLIAICIIALLFMQFYDSTVVKLKNSINNLGKYTDVEEYLKTFTLMAEQHNKKISINKGRIVFENINIRYNNKIVLKNFNYNIPPNSKVGLIGPIGSGKTSLLKALAGLTNYSGNIYIDGSNINNYDYDSFIKYVSYIPQHPKMFNKTIYYNLNYGSNYTQQEIMKFLKSINFHKFILKFQDGLNTNVGKEGSKLSGGQKQIIALLRALLQNKQIILLDEPTSSLDGTIKKLVINLLKNIKDKTLLIISHDDALKKLFDFEIDFSTK